MSQRTRVVLCTTPSIISAAVLNVLSGAPEIEVVGLVASTRVLKARYNFLQGLRGQIQLSGWRYSFYLAMVTQGYKLVPRCTRIPPLQEQLDQFAIPVLNTKDVNRESAWLDQFKGAVFLTAFFNQRIGVSLLSDHRWLNIHPGALPEYRGVDPVFFAMLDGSEQLLVTVHELEAAFDTGRVVATESFESGETLLDNTVAAFVHGAKLAVQPICDDGMVGLAQREEGARYDSWPGPSQVKRFVDAGNRLF